jgi:hypothetical protein
MGKVFSGGGDGGNKKFELSNDERIKIGEALNENYICPGAISEFSERLNVHPWVFQNGEGRNKDYGCAIEYFMNVWPDFEEKMRNVTYYLYQNRADTRLTEDVVCFYFYSNLVELRIVWALSLDGLREKFGEEVLDFVKSFKRPEDIVLFSSRENYTDFGRWLIEDWFYPHLKYFHFELEQERRKNENTSSDKKGDQNKKDENATNIVP